MNIIVNGKKIKCVAETVTISTIIEQLQLTTVGTAIAVGTTVVPQSKWSEYLLDEDAKITIIRATQGG